MLLKESKLRYIVRKILLENLPIDGVYSLRKNEPTVVDYNDPQRGEFMDDIYAMVQNSYSSLGGHFKVKTPQDLEKNYGPAKQGQWLVMDVDDDPQADIALTGKIDPGIPGVALGAAATDGSPLAKEKLKDLMSNRMSAGLWWGSASGKVGASLIKRGAPSIVHEEDVRFFEPGVHKFYGEYPLPIGAIDDSGMSIGANHPFRKRHGWFSRIWNGEEHLKLVFSGAPGYETESNS